MDEGKNKIPDLPDDTDHSNDFSRRDFLSQFGIAGFAMATSPVLSLVHPAAVQPAELAGNQVSLDEDTDKKENFNMPLVRIDAFEGRSDAEVKTLLDAVHRAIVKAVHIPERDRYQVYQAHPKGHFIVQDTGLAIPRTDKVLIITVFSKRREEILKRRLYKELTEELSKSSSIAPSDVMTCIVENTAADWSFGNGEAQFLTGELA